MLKQRILTALILIPLVILAILKLPHLWFALVLGLVLLLGAWEWSRIAGIAGTTGRLAFVAISAVVLFIVHAQLRQDLLNATILLWLVALFWIIMLIHVIRFNRNAVVLPGKAIAPAQLIYGLTAGWLILAGTFLGLVGLREHMPHGPQLVLLLMVLIWVADTAAYFTGRALGKRKLAVNVSPGKSWEGVVGALVATLVIVAFIGWYFEQSWPMLLLAQCVAIVTVVFSILGDLTESMFKRVAGIKDSGQILPGHGGIMDRIDSLTAGAPVFLLGLTLAGLP